MTVKSVNKRLIAQIADQLKRCSDAYYNSTPIVSDEKFDQLKNKLEELDPDHPFLSQIGAPIKGAWTKHKHRSLIGSLNKVNTKEELSNWAEDKGKLFVLTEKYDGSTIVATYKNGKLKTVATRGDGTIGENITPNAQFIRNLPKYLRTSHHGFSGEIRGEAMLTIEDFEKHFKPLGYKNPRNAANGKVRDQKNDSLKRHVQIFWFDVLPSGRHFKTEIAKWNWLKSNGLVKRLPAIANAEGIWRIFEFYLKENRDQLNYEIDGLVVKIDDLDLQESFGITSGRPKGAIAIKFPPPQKVTYLREIRWQRGLTGRICPVGFLEPINLGGVTVSRVSLCGMDEIKRLDLALGDKVLVSRRNDVIPKIEQVIDKKKSIQLCTNLDCFTKLVGKNLEKCPKCQNRLKLLDRLKPRAPEICMLCREDLVADGAYLVCMNSECQGETYGSLMTWIKKLKLKGFGPSIVRSLIEEDITDLIRFYNAELSLFQKAANSDKIGQRLFDVKESSREVRLSTMLSGLMIESLGSTNGQRLEKHFHTLDRVMNASIEELQSVQGIKTNAKKIYAGLQAKKKLIKDLRKLIKVLDLDMSGPLAGVSVCITGDLSKPRGKVQDWVRENGGEIKSGVSKSLTYLVTNTPNSNTNKNKKADQYGVKKLTEHELYALAE